MSQLRSAIDARMSRNMTIADAAFVLNVSERTIRRMIDDGRLSAFRLGEQGQYRIAPECVQSFERRFGSKPVNPTRRLKLTQ